MQLYFKILKPLKQLAAGCIVLLVGYTVQAQIPAFLPLEESMKATPVSFASKDDAGFFALQYHQSIGYKNAELFLQNWNGLFWTTYPKLVVEDFSSPQNNRMVLCNHNKEWYAAGSFILQGTDQGGVVRWNGNTWQVVGGGIWGEYAIQNEIDVADLVSFNNDLYICGHFNRASGMAVKNFAVLKGSVWQGIPSNTGKVNALTAVGDTLYAAGRFDSIGGILAHNVAALYQGSWHAVSGFPSEIYKLASYENSLIAFGADGVHQLTAGKHITVFKGDIFTAVQVDQSTVLNRVGYCSGVFLKPNGSVFHLAQFDGDSWKLTMPDTEMRLAQGYRFPLCSNKTSMYLGGPFSEIYGTRTPNAVEFQPGNTVVKGRVYMDVNENCIFDNGDQWLPNYLLNIDKGKRYYSCNNAGEFSFLVSSTEAHQIEVYPGDKEAVGCLGALRLTPAYPKDTTVILNFPIVAKQGAVYPEIELVSASGYQARHGYRNSYTLHVKSHQLASPITVKLQFQEGLVLMKSDLAYVRRGTSEMEWVVMGEVDINIDFLVDPLRFATGDTLRFLGFMESYTASTALNQRVVSAFDPNDKQCDKAQIGGKDKTLDYHIRFQNLGNDSAVSVFVVDTISPSLPMQFIRVTDNSHSQQYHLNYKIRDQAIIWNFSDIYLPPKSGSTDELSSGFVHFKAGIAKNLKVGDVIRNQAHIYFDYQSPVATNFAITEVTSTTFSSDSSTALRVWPNPCKQSLTLDAGSFLISEVKIYNTQGKMVYESKITTQQSMVKLNLPPLSAGIYIAKVNYGTGIVSQKLIVEP